MRAPDSLYYGVVCKTRLVYVVESRRRLEETHVSRWLITSPGFSNVRRSMRPTSKLISEWNRVTAVLVPSCPAANLRCWRKILLYGRKGIRSLYPHLHYVVSALSLFDPDTTSTNISPANTIRPLEEYFAPLLSRSSSAAFKSWSKIIVWPKTVTELSGP